MYLLKTKVYCTLALRVCVSLHSYYHLSSPHSFPPGPVDSITVRVMSLPDAYFDGNTTVTFSAKGIGVEGEDHLDVVVPQNMTVTFYHCREGSFWNLTSTNNSDSASCKVCTESAEGDTEVMGARGPCVF